MVIVEGELDFPVGHSAVDYSVFDFWNARTDFARRAKLTGPMMLECPAIRANVQCGYCGWTIRNQQSV
jgi:hypothetical protein